MDRVDTINTPGAGDTHTGSSIGILLMGSSHKYHGVTGCIMFIVSLSCNVSSVPIPTSTVTRTIIYAAFSYGRSRHYVYTSWCSSYDCESQVLPCYRMYHIRCIVVMYRIKHPQFLRAQ